MPGYRPTVAKLPSASSQGSTGRLRFSAEEVAFFVPRASFWQRRSCTLVDNLVTLLWPSCACT